MGDFATSEQKAKQSGATTSNATQTPWAPQQKYLEGIFKNAQSAYKQSQANPYKGDFVAGYRPEQTNMFQGMINYANTSPLASMLQGQGTQLGTMGTGAVGYGLQGLQDFRPNDTMGTIADAGLYADNPYMSGMVDAAMRDANRATYEEAIPQVRRNAAMSGNTNSSRTGAREAILERANMDRAADISSAMRGQAYQSGIGQAQNQRAMEMSRLSDLANQGLGTAAQGAANWTGSLGAMGALFGLGNAGGEGLRAGDQAALDNDIAKYDARQQQIWGPLMNYYNLVGDKSWGGTTTARGTTNQFTNSQNTASDAAVIGGLLTGLGGILPG